MRTLFALAICTLLVGCTMLSSETKLNRLAIGMTRNEVVEIMGKPRNTRATADVEILIYRLFARHQGQVDFFVRFRDGKVDAYGRPGDFNVQSVEIIDRTK